MRFVSYRVGITEPPGPAIIASKPCRPNQPPRICCNKDCYEIEWQAHAQMCETHWADYDQRKREDKARSDADESDGWVP